MLFKYMYLTVKLVVIRSRLEYAFVRIKGPYWAIICLSEKYAYLERGGRLIGRGG